MNTLMFENSQFFMLTVVHIIEVPLTTLALDRKRTYEKYTVYAVHALIINLLYMQI
jgi:hypothetical protein